MEPNAAAPVAPDAGGQPAAPAPAPAPAQPAAPAPANNQPTAEESDANEWDGAVDEIFPGLRTPKKEGNQNEPADPSKAATPGETPPAGQEGNQPPKPDGEGAEAGEEPADEENEPDFSSRDTRASQREIAQERETMVSDVREKVFADVPKTLVDADGDPIRGIEDVMKLINPRTITADNPQGRTFTEEEAGMFFLAAQQQFNKDMGELDKRVERIAETNLDLKDDADTVRYKYGELLKVLPDPENPKKLYRDTLWEDYQNTLVRDPKSGVIIQTPMPLRTFYERALAPYAAQAQQANAGAATPPANPAQPAQPATPPGPSRNQERTDRSDIFTPGGNQSNQDPEDAEWSTAIQETFSPAQLKNLNR